jgi:hypothetical protein
VVTSASAAKDSLDDFEARKATKEAIQRELDTLDIILMAKVSRTAITLQEYIDMRLAQGAAMDVIREDLLTDLNEGGRIFGEFRNVLRPTFSGSVNRFRDAGERSILGASGQYKWIAILINTCPDCLERHGQVQSMAEWEAEGVPRSGATVCAENCKCVLLPAEVAELEPIMRGN